TLGAADQALEEMARSPFPRSRSFPVLVQLLLDGGKEFLTDQSGDWNLHPLTCRSTGGCGEPTGLGGATTAGTQTWQSRAVPGLPVGGASRICGVAEQLQDSARIPPD